MPELPLTWINALFDKFERFYGQDFARKWAIGKIDPETGINETLMAMKREWAEGLGKFEGQTLRQAAEYCRENVPKPPSLPEFITICKQMRPAPEHQYCLPNKFEKTEYGLQMMEKIKTMLANKRIE